MQRLERLRWVYAKFACKVLDLLYHILLPAHHRMAGSQTEATASKASSQKANLCWSGQGAQGPELLEIEANLNAWALSAHGFKHCNSHTARSNHFTERERSR